MIFDVYNVQLFLIYSSIFYETQYSKGFFDNKSILTLKLQGRIKPDPKSFVESTLSKKESPIPYSASNAKGPLQNDIKWHLCELTQRPFANNNCTKLSTSCCKEEASASFCITRYYLATSAYNNSLQLMSCNERSFINKQNNKGPKFELWGKQEMAWKE